MLLKYLGRFGILSESSFSFIVRTVTKGYSTSCVPLAVSLRCSFLVNRNTGAIFHGFPHIDHTQDFVRKDIIGWLQWLCHNVGFQDFRFDYAKAIHQNMLKTILKEHNHCYLSGSIWMFATTTVLLWTITKIAIGNE
ncbi:putative glycosidase [Medicago truncatula]|uniref:1,4-alpha-D-glucan glucanohydrolase n=1 Tax=Medicago truncatula TaxID=3880 RepID=A0A396GIF5_MEDTR|nr:putative glycosidase [Medicago truncatula]